MNKFAAVTGFMMSLFAAGGSSAADNTPAAKPKVLIAYYSWSGHTKEVAEAIREDTGGEIYEIQTVKVYPTEYKAMTEQVKKEISEGFKPELKSKAPDLSGYDIVFLGSPNWWGTIAPAVSSFLDENNLQGKKVIPFITHGGGGVQNTIKNMTEKCVGCDVEQNGWVGYGSRTFGVAGWLKDMGFNK